MRDYTKVILLAHLVTYLSIGLNIPILRQIFGFIYLTFIPGFVILKVLKLREGKITDTILFSVGLSIAFLMFIGLLVNELYPLLGVSEPLSIIPLTITISGSTLVLFFVGCKHDLVRSTNANPVLESSAKSVSWQALFLVFLPLLSIVGALYANTPVLLLMIVVVAALCALGVFSSRTVPAKLYPLIIFAISIALLFHVSLTSKYIMGGGDQTSEYYIFKLTETKGIWNPPGNVIYYSFLDNLNSLLSITILPTIYSLLLNISGELIFKLFYTFAFSLLPLALYRIYERQTGKSVALLSAFFFMSSPITFYGLEPLCLSRQTIGELFLVLSIFILLDKDINPGKRKILYMIFGAAIVVSHYSLAYIYLFYIVYIYILYPFIFSYIRGVRALSPGKTQYVALVLFLIVITFSWYVYVSDSPLDKLLNSIQNIYNWFGADVLSAESRFSPTFSALSPLEPSSIVGWIHKILIYTEQFFILIGTVVLTMKPKKFKLDPKFRLLSIMSMFIILLCLVIPNLAPTLNLTRFYQITMLFLAPFFVLGGKTIFSWAEKQARVFFHRLRFGSYRNLELRLVSVVLVASFLFQVGFVNHVTGDYPYSYPLDLNRKKTSNDLSVRMNSYTTLFPDQDVFSSRWLLKNGNETSWVYSDRHADSILMSYALMHADRIRYLSNTTTLRHGAYIYLRYLSLREGVIITPHGLFNMSEFSSLINRCNKIYSNGDSNIYCSGIDSEE